MLTLNIFKKSVPRLIVMLILISVNSLLYSQNLTNNSKKNDSTNQDTLTEKYIKNKRPLSNPKDRFGDPFSNSESQSPLLLKDPSNLKLDVEIDTNMNYTIYEKIGDLNYRPTSTMTFEEFKQYQERMQLREYWKKRSASLDGESAVSSRNIIPPIYISPLFDRIFGGTYVEIIPRGFVTLDFGGRWQRINNPSLTIRQQKNGGFEFDQQINMNVVGKIGEKLQITANFDNNNSFDFENNLKVEYTGYQEDMLQKLEIGNVSLPLNNSLISGAQNLFGVKTQLQFGKLFVTSIASTQRGKTQTITVSGGVKGQGREFELQASDYDENKHFFLSHFFKDNYEKWLKTIPNINSGVNITRVEVYVVNRNNDTQTTRNILGLLDLGEGNSSNVYNNVLSNTVNGRSPSSNDANDLYNNIISSSDRNVNNIVNILQNGKYSLQNGTEFEKITTARKLNEQEFSINKKLGYISLVRRLSNDEALAVSFEYTYQGRNYKVGELTEDYSKIGDKDVIILKLLRPRKINIDDFNGKRIPSWDLMMKNIYKLNGVNLNREGFELRIIYRDDLTGIDNPQLQFGAVASTLPLIDILGLDRLNQNNDPQRDGNFDFIPDVTINSKDGLIIFPYLEPFKKPLNDVFLDSETEFKEKFVYNELYDRTRIDAELISQKNKFIIKGSVQSGSSKEIIIPGYQPAQGSVKVFAGGTLLNENVDYTVDYNIGKINIVNDGILLSGKDLSISYENADIFNFQSRTLLGTRFDYNQSEDINFGGTILRLNERPLVSRNNIGNEPIRNIKYGLDVNINKKSRLITKIIDKIPLISTKEPSSINFNAEFAQLVPGTSNIVDGEGTSYIDDFEASAIPFYMNDPLNWRLAATPSNRPDFIGNNSRGVNDYRSKLAWYSIDNLFYRNDSRAPDELTSEELENHYMRNVQQQEIFVNRDQNIINFQQVLNLAFYPNERGPYNYNTNLNNEGKLSFSPKKSWGGITYPITTEVDFDKANIEYIEFWLMDPFIKGKRGILDDGRTNPKNNTTGGDLYFNLGSISEDVIKDNRHGFENGLPPDGDKTSGVELGEWGYVTTQSYLTNAFDNTPNARLNQDVGLDGAKDEDEALIFKDFVSQLNNNAREIVLEDPSADNFEYFLNGNYDNNATILQRYKNFNGMENNSPVISGNNSFTPSATTLPDNEDLNNDNTINELEEYYEYHIPIKPDNEGIQDNDYIIDQVSRRINGDIVTWYLYRIPIRQNNLKTFGNINGFKSIKYLRMYLTNFEEPVVLRMVNFRFVSSRWRRYENTIAEPRINILSDQEESKNFLVSVVNLEENGAGTETQSPYVLPPGIERDQDNTSALGIRLNEQSLRLCVEDLKDGYSQAVFKQVQLDMINYGRIKMFLHADSDSDDGDLTAFLRLGDDVDSNYYEIEVPLKITPKGATSSQEIWPKINEIDISLSELYALKSKRDREGYSKRSIFPIDKPLAIGNNLIRMRGNPDLSSAKWLTIGIRNPTTPDGKARSACIWANELRVTDFDRTKGWAMNATLNTKLADFANITATTRFTSFGFGGIQSRIAERTREESLFYDVSASINLNKLFPENFGLQIPAFLSYERNIITPKFDPSNPDIKLDAALLSFDSEQERENFRQIVLDQTTKKSINFTNVKKIKVNQNAKNHIWDIENFTFNYGYSEMLRTNFNLQRFFKQNYNASVAYNYTPQSKAVEPFKNIKWLNNKYLQLVKDFNFNIIPTKINFIAELNREIIQTKYRNNAGNFDTENFQKLFSFNRNYNVGWGLAKSITIDYNATTNAIIDEPNSNPYGGINNDGEFVNKKSYNDSIRINFLKLGRIKNFNQNININYTLPLDKFPLTNWINTNLRYLASYEWRAGPIYNNSEEKKELDFGNNLQNSRETAITSKLDLIKLYNKVGFLKGINNPASNRQSTLNKNNNNKANDKKSNPFNTFLRILTSVKSINATYSLRQGTIIPGFLPRPYLFGLDSSFSDPGINFILGSQDASIRKNLADNGLITTNPNLTLPFTQTRSVDIDLNSDIQLSPSLNIQLNLSKTKNDSFEEIFKYNIDEELGEVNNFVSLSPSRSGSYSISFSTIKTAFTKDDDLLNSKLFKNFENNRFIIRDQFKEKTNIEYDPNSQDVLIPSFIAAYSGKPISSVGLSPFPNTPVPNWRIDYTGLNNLKFLKKRLNSISFNHSYNSTYSIINYSNSLDYNENLELNKSSNDIENYNNNFFGVRNPSSNSPTQQPLYVISQVLITEQFAPLIGINIRAKSGLTGKFEYRTDRELALNISNTQITERKNRDIVFEIGFIKKGMKLPWKSQGRVITLKNDLTFRFNFTVKNSQTVQRRIDEADQLTDGNMNLQIRPNVSYVLNSKLNLQFYFERSVTEPKISTSYPRAMTRAGFQIRFNLSQ